MDNSFFFVVQLQEIMLLLWIFNSKGQPYEICQCEFFYLFNWFWLTSLQKEEIGFEHQAAIMPDVPPPEQARISLFSSIWYIWKKEQTTNKQANAAP